MKKFTSALVALAALALSSVASATDYESVTFTNIQPVQTTDFNLGTLNTNVFTVGGYNLGKIKFSGTVEEINGTTGDFASENQIQVKYPDGRFKNVSLSTTTSYTGPFAVSGFFFLAYGEAAPYGGGTWEFRYINTFDDTPTAGVPDAQCTVTFTLSDEAPSPPAGVIDLGTLNNTGQVDPNPVLTRVDTHASGSVFWYKITIPEGVTGTKYLDIDTEGTTTFLTGNDTEIALYDFFGNLVATDDDDGSSLLSSLSFGLAGGSRPAVVTGSNTIGVARNGRDGDLAAGVYYVAVSGFNANFANGLSVTTNSTRVGDVALNFRTNVIGSVPKVVSGNVILNDMDPSCCAGQQVVIELRQPGSTTPDHCETVTLDANCNFTFTLPTAFAAGTYDIAAKHAKFLRRVLASQSVGTTGISGLSFSLLNGDCDDSNAIDIGDYALISSSYGLFLGDPGYDDRADLNCDGAIDIGDYGIMSANYGMFGDD